MSSETVYTPIETVYDGGLLDVGLLPEAPNPDGSQTCCPVIRIDHVRPEPGSRQLVFLTPRAAIDLAKELLHLANHAAARAGA